MKTFDYFMLFAFCSSFVGFSESVAAQVAELTGVSDEEKFGTVLKRLKVASLDSSCMLGNPTIEDAYYRSITRSAVEETWERYSAIRVTGWGTCQSENAPGIHIRIDDQGPHVKALGRYLNARPQGMVLNFSFGNWSLHVKDEKTIAPT